ncbi:hypothetical protein [Foetidibacter luteolus]|uniref:hypothetical protein n=1 Tax=Foetidibacter luteolus TaxID=2608880 RepID=UPI00129AEF0F|nr:hypothetical protein [Foetidibacter luteolus]
MKRDDTLWKGILENVFDDFLRFFIKDADEIFDMQKGFGFLDKELAQVIAIEEVEEPKQVDKLVKAHTRSGTEEWILIHVEVQGYNEVEFPRRMFNYFYRIWDTWQKPVTAFVIFTDRNKKFCPSQFSYSFLGTSLSYSYNVYKVILQDEKMLLQNTNPFAIVIAMVLLALKSNNFDDNQLFDLKLSLLRNLLKRKIPLLKVRKLLLFLHQYVRFANPDINIKFGKTIDILSEKNKSMDIEEMIIERTKKQASREAAIAIATKMIKDGTALSDVQRYTELDNEELKKLSLKLKKDK